MKAIKTLKAEGVKVTATAVYDLMQAYMALAAEAVYIAPQVNRLGNLGAHPMDLLSILSDRIAVDGYNTQIVAASFKGVQQVRDSFNFGAHAITAPVAVLKQIFANPNIEKAVQAYMALAANVDYIAPYVNRIGNLGADPMDLISNLSDRISVDGYNTKIVAASFKGVQQVRDSFNFGAHAITAPVAVLKQIFANPNIEKAVDDFNKDWYAMYGENVGICEL